MRLVPYLFALILTAAGALAQPQQLPPDFIANAVHGLDSASCARMGGQETRDGLGLTICILGTARAVYACAGEGFVVLIDTAQGETLLKTGSGNFGPVTALPAASGELLAGEHATLHLKGDEAVLIRPGGQTRCTLNP